MGVNIKKVLVCDAVDAACIELLEANGISVIICTVTMSLFF